MISALNSLLNLPQYKDPFTQRNARNVGYVAFTLAALMLLFMAVTIIQGGENYVYFFLGEIGGILLCIFAVFMVRAGRAQITGYLFVFFVLFISAGLTSLTDFEIRGLDALWVALVLTSAVAYERSVIFATLVSLVIFAFGAQRIETFDNDAATILGGIIFLGLLGWLTTNSLRATVQSVLEETDRRSKLLETTNLVTSSIFTRRELATLLTQTVDSIRDNFDSVYHAQVFLIDSAGRYAVLRASTGDVGAQLIGRGHKLAVGSQSVIGRVTQRGDYVLASDTSSDSVHKLNELLPNTKTELALPLRVTDGVIGALDIQSLEAYAFGETDIEIFQVLADQIALAIENARLLDNLQGQLQQNQQLLDREQFNRREIEQLNRELLGQGWSNYIQTTKPNSAQELNINTGEINTAIAKSAFMDQVLESRQVQIFETENGQVLSMPIMVEDIAIGTMEFEIPKGEVISSGIVDAMNTLRSRLGIVAENVRLFDQARSIASREQVVGDAAERLQQSRDLESLVTQAAPLFNEIMGAKTTRIRLGKLMEDTTGSNSQKTTNGHEA